MKKAEKNYFKDTATVPNVTGTHTLGTLLLSIQDIFIRYYRMNGYRTLWGGVIMQQCHSISSRENIKEGRKE